MRLGCLLSFTSVLVICSSCAFFQTAFNQDSPEAPTEMIDSSEMTSIIQMHSEEVRHNNNLHLQFAKTYYNQGISSIRLEFISQDILEMEEARMLIIDITENLLGKLNENPIVGPQFVSYPFRPENLEIYITFESFFGKFVDPYYVGWIGLEDGNIDYYVFDTEDNTKMRWHYRQESYATSREIVVYQREAQMRYAEEHRPLLDIFDNRRFYPKN